LIAATDDAPAKLSFALPKQRRLRGAGLSFRKFMPKGSAMTAA